MSVTSTNAQRFHAYMRAFRLGATVGVVTEWHKNAQVHEDEKIRTCWEAGYAQGRAAREDAVRRAAALTGHAPAVLHLAEDEP